LGPPLQPSWWCWSTAPQPLPPRCWRVPSGATAGGPHCLHTTYNSTYNPTVAGGLPLSLTDHRMPLSSTAHVAGGPPLTAHHHRALCTHTAPDAHTVQLLRPTPACVQGEGAASTVATGASTRHTPVGPLLLCVIATMHGLTPLGGQAGNAVRHAGTHATCFISDTCQVQVPLCMISEAHKHPMPLLCCTAQLAELLAAAATYCPAAAQLPNQRLCCCSEHPPSPLLPLHARRRCIQVAAAW
jgi:hypothetical protein